MARGLLFGGMRPLFGYVPAVHFGPGSKDFEAVESVAPPAKGAAFDVAPCAKQSISDPVIVGSVRTSSESGSPSSMIAPQISRLEDELATVRKRLRAQRAETRTEQQTSERLRRELADLRASLGQPESEASPSSQDSEKVEGELDERMSHLIAKHEAAVAEIEAKCAREIATLREKQEAKLNALRNTLRTAEELTLAKSERIKRLEARLAKLQQDDTVVRRRVKTASGADDLTALRGVGPAFARALRNEGVVTFSQISRWTSDEIARIAPKIGTTAGRIRKDEWVAEARKLANL